MFGSRRRAASAPRNASQNRAVPASAASAAAIAFIQKQSSDANLSAAAAAAALRSHTTSPEPPSSIQTKRMIRRGSQSSVGSPHGSIREPFGSSVQRRGSNASMTDRTFRSPSPGPRNAPAITTIPEDVPPLPTKSHMRTGSQDATPTTIVPTPNVGVVRGPPQPARISTNVSAPERPISPTSPRSSVNFSRPMSPPPAPSARMVQEAPPARPASSQGFYPLSVAAQVKEAQRARAAQAASGSLRAPPRPMSSAGVPASHAALLAAQAPQQTSRAQGNAPRVQAIPRPQSPPSAATSRAVPSSPAYRPTSPTARPSSPLARPMSPTDLSPSAINVVKRVNAAPIVSSTPPPARSSGAARIGSSGISGAEAQARASAHLARPLSSAVSEPITQPASSASRRTVSNATPPSVQTNETKQHSRAVSQPLTVTSAADRTNSISPSRSARFSTNPYLEPLKHDPLPRAASPAKSALKGSSSRSRGTSPAKVPSSVYSDTSDAVSEDGRKRKGVRVSFDEQGASVGQAADTQTPINDVLSPQHTRARTDAWANEEAKMGPRPLLPAFNSVGDRKSSTPERAVSPSPAEQAQPTTAGISSDEAAGAILSKDFARKQNLDQSNNEGETGTGGIPAVNVPSIAVLPSTPGLADEQKQFSDTVPSSNPEILEGPYIPGAEAQRTAEGPSAAAPTVDVQIVPSLQQMMRQSSIDDGTESDTTAELYEDAEEQPSDGEDAGGFASLDAIMESPSVETAPVLPAIATQAFIDPTATRAIPGSAGGASDAAPAGEEDWERVKSYWSNLSESQKLQLETEAEKTRLEREAAKAGGSQSASSNMMKAKHTPQASQDSEGQTRDSLDRQPVHMKQSMRASHQRTGSDSTHMRTSMRDSSPAKSASMRTSMRGENQRPQSAIVNTASPRTSTSGVPAGPASTTQAASTALAMAIAKQQALKKPALERTTSNGSSASESSFRKGKKRAGSATGLDAGGGRVSMKRSMRGPSPAPENARPQSPSQQSVTNRLSMRSPSPSMRTSLRAPAGGAKDSSGPTLRGSKPPEAKSSFFGRSSKPKAEKAKTGKATRSRFADSSDEDDDVPAGGYTSRFADSDASDDEPVQTLRPVRGIPKKGGLASGESTELDESDEERKTRRPFSPTLRNSTTARPANITTAAPSTPTKANGNATQGLALQTGTLRGDTSAASTPPQPKAKRGFFGLGRRKQATSDAPGSPSLTAPSSPAPAPATPSSPAIIAATAAPSSPAIDTVNAEPTSTAVIAATAAPASPAVDSVNTGSTSTAVAPQIPEVPHEPPITLPKTMRQSEPAPSVKSEAGRGRKIFRRFSSSNAGSPARAPTAADFPYPPPPIPDEYKSSYTGNDRPSTSDGFQHKTLRPALGDKRVSTMTAPDGTTGGKKPDIYSERTGKKKRGQWIRKMLGVYD